MMPRNSGTDNDNDGDSSDDEEDEQDEKALKQLVSNKFRELELILARRVIPGLVSMQEETAFRLDSVERTSLVL